MGYSPPKGVRPPQLEGKRSGRPKGSKNMAGAWRDALWGYWHSDEKGASPPSAGAAVWRLLARRYPEELEEFLEAHDKL
jgi:hypothetical protein